MKQLLVFLFLVLTVSAIAQYPINQGIGGDKTMTNVGGGLTIKGGILLLNFVDTLAANLHPYVKFIPNNLIMTGDILRKRNAAATAWINLTEGSGATVGGTVGGNITSNRFTIGFNPGTNLTSAQWIDSVFYHAQPPTATLTGGGTFEFTSASTFNTTLNWSSSRQSASTNLATIVVAGVNKTFTQPSAPGTVSGTQSVSVPTNTNTTYSNITTTVDAQSVTATTTFTYQNKIYAGFVTTATPSDADIIAATNSTYVGGQFATTRNQSGALTTPSSSKYIFFAAPTPFGTPNIVINGLGVTFNLTTRTFINASGYSSSYIIAVSPFPTAGAVDNYIVN